jgi:hypothetical protein
VVLLLALFILPGVISLIALEMAASAFHFPAAMRIIALVLFGDQLCRSSYIDHLW